MKLNPTKDYIVYFAGWYCGYLKSITTGTCYISGRPFIQVELLCGKKYGSFTDCVPRLNILDKSTGEWYFKF